MREETREAILQAARRAFRAQGYHASSVADIVGQARVARGTFYIYFRSKQDVLLELIERFLQEIRQQVRRIDTSAGAAPPIHQVRDNLARIFRCIDANEDVAAVVFMGAAGLDPASRARVEAFWARIEDMVRDALAVGQGLGVVRPCHRPTAAIMALGAARDATARMLAEREAGDTRPPHDRERFLSEMIHFILRGLLRQPDLVELPVDPAQPTESR